jgi:membrane protease YdiL (CAAX protease family)
LRRIWNRPALTIIVISLLWSLAHAYPIPGSASVFAMGLMMGFYFSARRSLWPLVIAHWGYNVMLFLV